jgi:hypothetical protein
MKILLASVFILLPFKGMSQDLQLHYDFRHTIDPEMNSRNFPVLSFEYFKNIDTVETGSFLFKINAQLNGKNSNVGQVYAQVSQTLRFWKPKIFLYLNYSGGLGVTSASFGYYLYNSFSIGMAYPVQWKGAWIATSLSLRITVFDQPSYDPQLNLYFGKGYLNYKIFIAGSFIFWTQNNNQGNDYTKDFEGKKFVFFGDPQIWFRIVKGFSAGTRINVYYNLLGEGNQLQLYPTLGLKYQF